MSSDGPIEVNFQPPPFYAPGEDHPRRYWVCDGCMKYVVSEQIADMADGEHVICKGCAK